MEIINNKALLVRTRNPNRIIDSILKSKLISTEQEISDVLVNWQLPESRELAKVLKYVPSPITRDYQWPGKFKPFEHQKKTAEFLSLRDKAFCFNEQGTGKTASAIWAADYLMKQGQVKRVLVICPLSIMRSAWQADLFKFAIHRRCGVAHGSKIERQKVLASNAEFVIVNHDGIVVIEDLLKANPFDLIIVDEASAFKNVGTNRWKALKNIANVGSRLWMMTGTPASQSPLDAYGLAKLVNPERAPKFFGQYRDMVMTNISRFKWIARPKAETIVHSILQPAIRFEKKDCLDLPSVTFVEREAPLTPQQRKYYQQLKAKMMFVADGEEVTALNAAASMSKLLQISGGAVYTDNQEVVEFDVSNRLQVVEEVINEATNKVLVFVPFRHTLKLLHTHLNKLGIKSEVINGDVSLNKRSDIFDAFQTKTDPRVLLIQPQAASHGLTLTAANVIVWYAPVTSVETYLQANARIDRPGQLHPMTIVHISGSPVEKKLYSMLQGRIDVHSKIIELYKEL